MFFFSFFISFLFSTQTLSIINHVSTANNEAPTRQEWPALGIGANGALGVAYGKVEADEERFKVLSTAPMYELRTDSLGQGRCLSS